VQDDERRVLTHDGELIDYDALAIAVGAHERGSAPPLITWGQEPDQGQLGALLGELAAGTVKSVAVTVPAGAGWPLAGYEAALILAWTASHLAPTPVSVTVITAEERPASGLGPQAADWVSKTLADAGVEVSSSSVVHSFTAEQDTHDRGGGHTVRVTLGDAAHEITVDRALCVPESFGPDVSGLPSVPQGFLPTRVDGRVVDSDRVWALGDAAQRALRHSIITATEADFVASSIIATLGLGEPSGALLPALHGILVDAPRAALVGRQQGTPPRRADGERMPVVAARGGARSPPRALGPHPRPGRPRGDPLASKRAARHRGSACQRPDDREAHARRSSTGKGPAA
jgi:NADH dehydrogenase FAD-containing subunit